jgi:GNAT superfamily N-acetyltransferase
MVVVREGTLTPSERSRIDRLVELADRLADAQAPAGPITSDEQPPAEPPESPPDARVPELRSHADLVVAEVDDRKVGEARLLPTRAGWGVRVYVHPAWRRRGLGLRLLHEVSDVAVDRGIGELEVRLDAHDLVGLRLVLASGLCGSISCDGGETRTRLVLERRAADMAVPSRA